MDIVFEITKMINNIVPLDNLEQLHQSFVVDWIASGANIFRIKKPANPDVHLVSYFVPVDERSEKILLVHHRKANLWLPPGGHVDVNEHPKDTVIREMEEELFTKANLSLEEPLFLTVAKTVNDVCPHTDVTLWYVVKGDSQIRYSFDSREFYDVRWFSLNELPQKKIESHLLRFLSKLKKIFCKRQVKMSSFG